MEHKHPSVWAINSIVCSKLQERFLLLPQGWVILVIDHWSDFNLWKTIAMFFYPSTQPPLLSPCMKGRSDAITREIQTHSSDTPIHFLFIVCRRTVCSREQTQDKILSWQGLKLKLISVVGFLSKSKFIIWFVVVKKQMSYLSQSSFVALICGTFWSMWLCLQLLQKHIRQLFLWSGVNAMFSLVRDYYLHWGLQCLDVPSLLEDFDRLE